MTGRASFQFVPDSDLTTPLFGIVIAIYKLAKGCAEMTDDHENSVGKDDPISSLSQDQIIQFTEASYLGNLRSPRRNATKAIRTSEFDIPKHDINKDFIGR